MEDSDEPCAALTPAGEILYANGAMSHCLDLAPGEGRGVSLYDCLLPSDRESTLHRIAAWRRQGAAGTLRLETWLRSRSGEPRAYECHFTERPAGGAGKADEAVLCARLRDLTARRRDERKMLEDEIWYRTVLASVLEPLVTMDAHGVIQSASDSVEAAFGYPPQELVGRKVSSLMPEPQRTQYEAYLRSLQAAAPAGAQKQVQEFPVLHRDGKRIDMELAITRFELPDRAQPFFTGAFRDVSARQRAEEDLRSSEEVLSAIFDSEYKYRCIVSVTGSLLRVNRTCLKALKLEGDEVLGRQLSELPWWQDSATKQGIIRDTIALAAQGSTQRFDFDMCVGPDRWIKVDLSFVPIFDKRRRVRFLYFEARDVTRERNAEEAERNMLRTFAEIGESAAEVIHEIKNPISGIHLALRVVAKELKQDERAVLEDLASRLSRLEQRLRRTLQFARPVQARCIPLSATAVLNRAIEEVQPAARGRAIAIELNLRVGDVRFSGDPELLHEALVNLLVNALECGTPRVRAGALEDGDRVSFFVEDAGPGVPPEKREEIFRPFVTTKSQGNGMGLTLVRKAALTHGGSISVDRGELGGARFTLLVPALSSLETNDAC